MKNYFFIFIVERNLAYRTNVLSYYRTFARKTASFHNEAEFRKFNSIECVTLYAKISAYEH